MVKLFLFIPLLYSYVSFIKSKDCKDDQECFLSVAIDNAKNNKITDRSSSLYGCMLSDWSAKLNEDKTIEEDKIKVYDVYAYERLLVCYKKKKVVVEGENARDIPRRKVPPGTRFHAEVTCINNDCSTTWKDFTCCYDANLEKY